MVPAQVRRRVGGAGAGAATVAHAAESSRSTVERSHVVLLLLHRLMHVPRAAVVAVVVAVARVPQRAVVVPKGVTSRVMSRQVKVVTEFKRGRCG